MTITTTLTWVRYDGTPETLPEKSTFVLLVDKDDVRECALYTDYNCGGIDLWVWGLGYSKPVAIGDLWAPWPEAPEAV